MNLNFQLTIDQDNNHLPPYSDKVILPSHVLSDVIKILPDEILPHPLIFKISAINDGDVDENSTFIGVKEFSSPDNTIQVPKYIYKKLNISISTDVNIQLIQSVPKATSLIIKPRYFYSDILNWKYFLENKLNKYYTVLKQGETIIIEDNELRYELFVENLNNGYDGWTNIIDTDIILDVIASNDEDAKAQLDQQQNINEEEIADSVELEVGSFLDSKFKPLLFKIDLTKFKSKLFIKLSGSNLLNTDVIVGFDKLVSLENFRYTTMNQDESIENGDLEFKYIVVDLNTDEVINKLNRNDIDDSYKYLYLIPFTWDNNENIQIELLENFPIETTPINSDSTQCENCLKYISNDKVTLHEVYCKRNNTRCPKCNKVFLKQIPSSHWHCPLDNFHTESELIKFKHNKFYHLNNYSCCNLSFPDYFNLILDHKSTICPEKLILCRFCHLIVKQELATYQDNFENLTHHEHLCSVKTIECFKCGRIIKQKDLTKHLKSHDLDKIEYNKKQSSIIKCSNINCINIKNDSNEFGLCEFCFGPLYSTQFDPDKKKFKMRLERRYMIQLSKGCGNEWCNNYYCKTSNLNLVKDKTIKDLLNMINNELISKLNEFYFCVSQSISIKKVLFDLIKSENEYGESIILKAINENKTSNDENGIRAWLDENGIKKHD
ncbi:unnamed protein product [Candida verbasci]|uniref:Ubiquitin-protein ligase E3A N-terminal zinc-binding domain-containing protein n=1 Tax=Candida verbasci TaxID=1227364 RepID=A0A9W4U0J4_9ASCO|nr:unnamed protein product [Candida verbasci]